MFSHLKLQVIVLQTQWCGVECSLWPFHFSQEKELMKICADNELFSSPANLDIKFSCSTQAFAQILSHAK